MLESDPLCLPAVRPFSGSVPPPRIWSMPKLMGSWFTGFGGGLGALGDCSILVVVSQKEGKIKKFSGQNHSKVTKRHHQPFLHRCRAFCQESSASSLPLAGLWKDWVLYRLRSKFDGRSERYDALSSPQRVKMLRPTTPSSSVRPPLSIGWHQNDWLNRNWVRPNIWHNNHFFPMKTGFSLLLRPDMHFYFLVVCYHLLK